MKKITTLIIAICFCVNLSIAQTYVTQVKSFGDKEWYYVNPYGEKIFAQGFEKSYRFSKDGLAPVFNMEKKEFFFVNLKGETLTTDVQGIRLMELFGFDINGYEDGMVPIKKDGKWGYLNTSGKLAVPLKYTAVTEFNNGYALVEILKQFIIIDKLGKETLVNDPQILNIKHFSEGLAPFHSIEKKAGYIDTEGKIAIAAKFHSVGYFVNDIAWAKLEDRKVGFINKKGEWVIEPKFLSAGEFEKVSGMARVKKDDETTAYVNRKGEVLQVSGAEVFGEFNDGLAFGRSGDKVGFFDNTGTWVIEKQFDAVLDFRNGYAAARKDKVWGMIDKKGNWTMKPTYDGVRSVTLVE